jgi:hypothetical protein
LHKNSIVIPAERSASRDLVLNLWFPDPRSRAARSAGVTVSGGQNGDAATLMLQLRTIIL